METVSRSNTVIADRYVIERELGRGGMATVFLARDRRHETLVAMKILHPELAPHFAGERFAREIRITAGLQHPNVVPVLDSGETEGLPFYVMPFVDGESLASRLAREHQLPVSEALRIATDVADALAYAHERGFIHRDIKPQNILLSSGHAVLADFGIARALDVTGGERITESGVALGTATYMSPEQAAGQHVDGRSDIYALGCVLYEMLAGSPPFGGPTPQTILARHAVDPVPPIRTVRQSVGPALEETLAKALAKVPADRFPNARDLKSALLAATAEQATLPATGSAPRTRAVPRRRTIPIAAIVGALAAIGGVFAWNALRPRVRAFDRNRIAVYPLSVPSTFEGPRSLGEDIATVIGHALDGAGRLRSVDGWQLLDAGRRDTVGALTNEVFRKAAQNRDCGFYVFGKLVPLGDSVTVYLELIDVASDSVVKKSNAIGPASAAWRVGVRAANQLLPALIPGAADRELVTGWVDRDPNAVAAFLLGEAAFRRARPAEALAHYRDALRDDSTFSLAAVRGAQAATWDHRASEASSLIQLALTQPLSPRYAHFARGYQAYLEGRPDSAGTEFRRVLAIDPDMSTAWMQLGETYTHLLPINGAPGLAADSAFTEAMRLDSTATHMLLHPIESRLRRGLVAEAEPLIARFLAAEPDSTLAAQIRVMHECVARSATKVGWKAAVATSPAGVLYAAQSLAVAGSQLPCAAAAYAAIRTYETPAMAAADRNVDARRWTALIGLQGVLLAEGRAAEAATRVDSAIARGEGGHSLMLIEGPLARPFEPFAARAVQNYETQWGKHCERCTSSDRLWQLGVWATYNADTASLNALASALGARAKADTSGALALIANATAARARLARGDTTGAITALTEVLATPVPSGSLLTWRDQEGRGPERLALARVLFARREFLKAIQVADVFDSPANQGYVAYVPASLTLRSDAADSLRDVALSASYHARLSALRRLGEDTERR